MIPKDLAGFTTEQLRGFNTAVTLAAQELDALIKESADNKTADNVSELSRLLDERDRLNAAIEASLEAASAEENVDDAANADATDATEDETENEDGANGDDTADGDNADAVVDEAVASANLGGGSGPSVTSEPRPSAAGEMRKFLRAATNGKVTGEHRMSFATMQRETNVKVREGADATDAIKSARLARKDGSDKTAAGCFCGPDDARQEIVYSGQTDRPLSDTLPTITANGDYRFIRQIPLADALTGVTEAGWFCADQDDVDPDDSATWKPVYELDCQTEVTSETYAVAAAAQFNTMQMIGNPALIDNLEHVMQVAYNRVAELLVYGKLLSHSTLYNYGLTTPVGYGASAQMINAIAWGLELIRQNVRDVKDYTLVLPAGVRERINGDGMVRATDDYRTWDDFQTRIADLGIDKVVEMIDPIGPVTAVAARGAAATPALAHTLSRQILLHRSEDFLLGLNPEVDLGVMRSPELARQNKLQWFTESFESVERVGIEPALAINVELCRSGVRPAFGEGTICD